MRGPPGQARPGLSEQVPFQPSPKDRSRSHVESTGPRASGRGKGLGGGRGGRGGRGHADLQEPGSERRGQGRGVPGGLGGGGGGFRESGWEAGQVRGSRVTGRRGLVWKMLWKSAHRTVKRKPTPCQATPWGSPARPQPQPRASGCDESASRLHPQR